MLFLHADFADSLLNGQPTFEARAEQSWLGYAEQGGGKACAAGLTDKVCANRTQNQISTSECREMLAFSILSENEIQRVKPA